MKLLITAACAAPLLMLTACDTTSAIAPYQPSTPNVLAFQTALKPSYVRVGDFTAEPGVAPPTCRMYGKLDVTSGKPLEAYVKDALQSELFQAGVYDVNSPVTIMGQLKEVQMKSLGTGSWTLALQVTSNRDPIGYSVTTTRVFKSSYTAGAACQNATNAFAPSVQDLIGQVVNNAGFARLVGKAG